MADEPQDQGADGSKGGETPNYDAWIAKQDEATKALIAGHIETTTAGLKKALGSERSAASDYAKQMKDLQGKAEKGSEAEKALADLSAKASESARRAAVYEAMPREITNPKLAYRVIVDDDLFDKHGQVDWDKFKKSYPELHAKAKAPDAGGGKRNEGDPGSLGIEIADAAKRYGVRRG